MNFIKGLFKALGGLLLLFVVLIVGLIKYGSSSGESKLKEFFGSAQSSTLEQIEDQLHPGLKEAFEPQQIAVFIKGIATRCGAFQTIKANGFSFSDKLENGTRLQEYEGWMVFEKAELPLKIKFADGKLVAINVDLEKAGKPGRELMEAVSVVPANLAPYQKLGEQFLRTLISGDVAKTTALMAEELKREFDPKVFPEQIKQLPGIGQQVKIEFLKSKPRPEDKTEVDLFYKCTFNGGDVKAHVKFSFVGPRAALMGFQYPTKRSSD